MKRDDTTRVSLDLTPEELAEVDQMAEKLGIKTKAALIRRALRFYAVLLGYKNEGYLIQAIRGGTLYQFPELNVPYGKLVERPKNGVKK